MSNKRIYLVALLLALVLPILAACGGGNGATTASPAASTGGTTASAPAASTEASAPAASTEASAPAASTEASAAASTAASPAASTASGDSGGDVAALDLSAIPVEDGATLRVTSWGDPPEQQINQDSFARFNEIFPNVTIEYEPVPQDYQTRVKADFAGGTNADVMYIDPSLITALAPSGQLLDLTPYMQQVNVNRDSYVGQLADIFVQDDKIYGLPKDFGALALFVRNDFAEQAGIDPNSIQTWDDWTNAAQKMTANGVLGQCFAAEWQRVGALWEQQGVEVVQDNKITLTDPKIIQATQFWTDLYKNKFAALPAEVGSNDCTQAFGQGQVAMAMEGGWMINGLDRDFADVEYTVIPIPTPEGGEQGSLVYTNAWGAAASTQYPNAAAALVLFLTSAQNQKPIMETGFALPTVQSLLDDPYFEQNPNIKVVAEAGEYATPAALALGSPTTYEDVLRAINTQGIEPIVLGGSDIQTALETAQQEAQVILDSAPAE